MERYAFIMAGGAGTRLWPISTEKSPKQFIDIGFGKSLIAMTLERLYGVVDEPNRYVITNQNQLDMMKNKLQGLINCANIIPEPLRKNTCACITYASLYIRKKFGNGMIAFTPSDSYIGDNDEYKLVLQRAYEAAEAHHRLVVVGVVPSYAATGYGYIHYSQVGPKLNEDVFPVLQFIEKPSSEKAKEYLASGKFLWNSGMLVGSSLDILDRVERYMPELYHILSDALDKSIDKKVETALKNAYMGVKSISFDYGVLEKCDDLLVVRATYNWSDIGSLDALGKIFDVDSKGNSIVGKHVGIDTANSVVYSTNNNLIATIGLDGIVVVNAGRATLVCPKSRVQEVKDIINLLVKNGCEEFL